MMIKKMMTTLIITLFCSVLIAPPFESVAIIRDEPICPYEAIWKATCKVESNFNPFAIGDRHLRDKSYGIVQVRKARLSDYLRQTGISYTESDMFDPAKSKEVFMHYAFQIDYRDTERISREWNGGKKGMQKKATKKYFELIKAVL
jgi:hypothetical protein